MRLAIIDLGTNSIRFDIHEINVSRSGNLTHRRLYREKAMVRLGQNLFLAGKLSDESKRRTLEAVEGFSETIDALRVDKVVAFGTAAVRDAADGEAFLDQVKEKTGIEFRTISGAEEASLIAKGILALEKTPKGLFALVDIGGGSTEISICKDKKVLSSHSFNLGVAKLQQVFLKTQPPKITGKKNPVRDLRDFIKSVVLPIQVIQRWPKVPVLIGSSGSVMAVSKLVHRDRDAAPKPIVKKELHKTVLQIQNKTSAELLSMQGMEPKRVDLILAGSVLLDEVSEILGAKEIRSTEFALRDGILVDELARFSKQKNKTFTFSLPDIEKRVHQWGLDQSHYEVVRHHAEWLFDHLRPIHKLKSEWRTYLSAAATLHDVGEVISHAHHAEHSEYMVKNANFVGMQVWEANFIAGLCRYHKDEKISEAKNEKKIPYPKKHELRMPFLKLLAIIQIADALDRSHKEVVKLQSVHTRRGNVEIRFKSRSPCDLELLRFDQKKALFEQVFKVEAALKRVR